MDIPELTTRDLLSRIHVEVTNFRKFHIDGPDAVCVASEDWPVMQQLMRESGVSKFYSVVSPATFLGLFVVVVEGVPSGFVRAARYV